MVRSSKRAFQPSALEGYIDTMVAISDRYFQAWATNGTLTWYPQLRRYTFDIACKLLVGLDDASETELGDLFESWCSGLFTLPINLPWTSFGKAMRSRDRLLPALEKLIRDRKKSTPPSTPDLAKAEQKKRKSPLAMCPLAVDYENVWARNLLG